MARSNVTRTIAALRKAGYEEINDLDVINLPTFPAEYRLSLQPFELIDVLSFHPNISLSPNGVLIFTSPDLKYHSVPLVNRNPSENVYQYYRYGVGNSVFVGLVNGYPCFTMVVSNTDDIDAEGYVCNAPFVAEVTKTQTDIYIGSSLKSTPFELKGPEQVIAWFTPERMAEVFTQGYTYNAAGELLISTRRLISSAALPHSVWLDAMKYADDSDILNCLNTRLLDSGDLLMLLDLAKDVNNIATIVKHHKFTKETALEAAESIVAPQALTIIARNTYHPEVLHKILQKTPLNVKTHDAALNNPNLAADDFTREVKKLSAQSIIKWLKMGRHPLTCFTFTYRDEDLKLGPKNLTTIIDYFCGTAEGLALIEDELVRNDTLKPEEVGVFPAPLLNSLALQTIADIQPVPEPK